MPKIKITTKPSEELDWKKALEHLDDVEKYLLSFKGELGHNPYIAIRLHIKPLLELFGKGDRSPDLYKQIMALQKTPPTL